MWRPGKIWAVALVVASSASMALAADVIERRAGGAKLSGKITAVSKDKVSIETTKGEKIDVPTNEVAEIQWDGEPAALRTGRTHEAAGRLPQAIESLTRAVADNKSDSENIKTDIDYYTIRAQARLALTDPSKIPDVLKKLTDFQAKHADSRHFYDDASLTIELNLVKGDPAAAKSAAESLSKAAGNEQKMAAKIALARVSLAENNIPDAQKGFEEVSGMSAMGAAEESRKLEAKLGLARCLQLQNKLDDAVKLLDEVVTKASPEDSRVQAEAYLRQGDCFQAANKTKEALLAYLHVDLLFATEKAAHPEALYHLSKLWQTIQQPDRANEAADKLTTEYPNSPWAQKLKTPAPAAAAAANG